MPEPSILELLDPAALARIDNYSLLARTVVEGYLSGLHRSLFQGYGSEFFQYRTYAPGDDLKYVDWKAFARRDKFYTKIFQEETNMNTCLFLDTSASMDYQGRRAPCSKLRYSAMIGACLAYLATRQGDNVAFYAYNSALDVCIKPSQRPGHLHRVLVEMARMQAKNTADHERVLGPLIEDLRRRGVIVIISDLLEADQGLERILKRFRYAHHECVVFQVLDPDELDFPFEGTTRFLDSEHDGQVVTSPPVVRESYLSRLREYLERMRLTCLELDVDYLLCRTSENLGNMLAAYLHRRESLR